MRPFSLILFFFIYHLLIFTGIPHHRYLTHAASGSGQWNLLQKSIGISAMHMQLLNNDRVVIYDRTDFNVSKLPLPNGKCRDNSSELIVKVDCTKPLKERKQNVDCSTEPFQKIKTKADCTAHSAEYDVPSDSFRPLMVLTNVWCSSGTLLSDGTLLQTGGYSDGARTVRTFRPCAECDWEEIKLGLTAGRWYATNQILPDGRVIVIGGRGEFNYEYYPKTTATSKLFSLPFLAQTNDAGQDKASGHDNNLYPFVHLNVDGNLFIFANNRAILLDYKKNVVVKSYPQIPGGDPRNYPSSGSSVLLPLKNLNQRSIEAEVLICGGAPRDSFNQVSKGVFVEALKTCARIKINDASPQWVLEDMPLARVMGDMTLLPDGNVLIINGAGAGTGGAELGRNPVLNPVLYRPDNLAGSRFEVQNPSTIPRTYHATAILLRDGRVLVGGSNPHIYDNYTAGVLFPTELSLEAFSPGYLDSGLSNLRPKIVLPASQTSLNYGQTFAVRYRVSGTFNQRKVMITMVAPSFTTHANSMNQRLLVLGGGKAKQISKYTYETELMMPYSNFIAPSGYYLLFVVHQDVPSEGIWVHIK